MVFFHYRREKMNRELFQSSWSLLFKSAIIFEKSDLCKELEVFLWVAPLPVTTVFRGDLRLWSRFWNGKSIFLTTSLNIEFFQKFFLFTIAKMLGHILYLNEVSKWYICWWKILWSTWNNDLEKFVFEISFEIFLKIKFKCHIWTDLAESFQNMYTFVQFYLLVEKI